MSRTARVGSAQSPMLPPGSDRRRRSDRGPVRGVTAALRRVTASLRRMLRTWVRTVLTDTNMAAATSSVLSSSERWPSTSSSLAVNASMTTSVAAAPAVRGRRTSLERKDLGPGVNEGAEPETVLGDLWVRQQRARRPEPPGTAAGASRAQRAGGTSPARPSPADAAALAARRTPPGAHRGPASKTVAPSRRSARVATQSRASACPRARWAAPATTMASPAVPVDQAFVRPPRRCPRGESHRRGLDIEPVSPPSPRVAVH